MRKQKAQLAETVPLAKVPTEHWILAAAAKRAAVMPYKATGRVGLQGGLQIGGNGRQGLLEGAKAPRKP